jgi:hypothetical protein
MAHPKLPNVGFGGAEKLPAVVPDIESDEDEEVALPEDVKALLGCDPFDEED